MKTHEEFIRKMEQRHPRIKIVGTYQGTANKIEWICSNCGKHQFSLPLNLLKKDATGLCRKCFNLKLASKSQKSHEQFMQKLNAIHPDIIVSGIYHGNNRKIEWVCLNCGKEQLSFPGNLLKPTKTPFCQECSKKLKSSRVEKRPDGSMYSIDDLNAKRFYEKLSNRNHPAILLDEYRGVKEKLRFKCSICGHIWYARPNDYLISKHPCPKCADRNHALKNDEFITRLSAINPYVIPLEEYKRQDQHIKCKCSRCGHVWSVTPGALLGGNGCPGCCHTATSYFEQFLLLSLRDVLGEEHVLSRDRKTIGTELDIYIPEKNVAFEYGSWFYHKNRISNDLKKLEKCQLKGIRLIRIYDGCGTETIKGNDVFCFAKNIALDLSDSIDVVNQLFSAIDIYPQIDDDAFSDISDKAYLLSRKMTTEQFKKKVSNIQPNIEILGEYKSSSNRISCKCKKCGHNWHPYAKALLVGYGCPNCYHQSQKKDADTYIKEMHQANPNLELLESYIASNKRILVKCNICGRQWRPYASTLLHGYGCSQCKKNAAAEKAIAEIKRIHPQIIIIGEYQGTNKTIKVKCSICGQIWTPIVDNLIRNVSHCPGCSRKVVNQKLRMSNDEFARRLSLISTSIEPLEEYTGSNNKIKVRCKECGYEWSPRAIDLLSGKGCQKCKRKMVADKQRRTPEDFIEEIGLINPSIKILGAYSRANDHIEVECIRCGRKWSPVASSLLNGTGCPSCSKRRVK